MTQSTKPNECEICPTVTDKLVFHMGMWMCASCKEKEDSLQAANNTPEMIQARITESNSVIAKSRTIDQSVQLVSDIFNAKTVAIVELISAINSDDSIANKNFAIASELAGRINHLQSVMTQARQTLVDAGNEQRAYQEYMNNYSNKLRSEERERLKLMDISYTAIPPKTIKPKSDRKPRHPKFDKELVRNVSAQFNVPMEAVQLLVVQKNMTPQAAAEHMAKMLRKGN